MPWDVQCPGMYNGRHDGSPLVVPVQFFEAFKAQIGINRPDGKCPYSRIMCLNSGSEAVELSARLTDVHCKTMTSAGGVSLRSRDVFLLVLSQLSMNPFVCAQ